MKKVALFLLLWLAGMSSFTSIDAKVGPYFKIARGTAFLAGALYCAANAWSWHNKAEHYPASSMAEMGARYRSYFYSGVAVFLGAFGLIAIESGLEHLD